MAAMMAVVKVHLEGSVSSANPVAMAPGEGEWERETRSISQEGERGKRGKGAKATEREDERGKESRFLFLALTRTLKQTHRIQERAHSQVL